MYCDDILIFSKTSEENLVHVQMVLETLWHHKLYAKASRCQFGRFSVGFLGHVISEHGVAVTLQGFGRCGVGHAHLLH